MFRNGWWHNPPLEACIRRYLDKRGLRMRKTRGDICQWDAIQIYDKRDYEKRSIMEFRNLHEVAEYYDLPC